MNQARPLRIGVIFGGRSSEHEVSLSSAQNVMDALEEAGYTVIPIGIAPQGRWLTGGDPMKQLSTTATSNDSGSHPAQDEASLLREQMSNSWALLPHTQSTGDLPSIDVIFPVLHGPYGEDGTLQGLLEMANLPYVGCGVLSSAVAMDKVVAKRLFAAEGLRQALYHVVMRRRWQQDRSAVLNEIENSLPYPTFVKPANLGSSVGISKAENRSGLTEAIDLACQYDGKILIEEAVANVREIELSVLGNDDPIASVPGEIVPGHEFYDYAAKYLDDSSQLLIPASLDAEQTAYLQNIAIRAFRAVEGSGLARVDFLLDDASGAIYLNEINTMPGFTRISMYPKLWEASGINYPELVDRLVQLALERFEDRQLNSTGR